MQSATINLDDVYAAHSGWLQDWLKRRTRCPHRAWDLTQDTFCRVLEQAEPPAIRDPRGFLAVIARRLLIDDVRRRTIEQAYVDACAVLEDGADHLTPERILGATQMLDGLWALLSGLPADTRNAFLLRKVDGLTHIEIADRLGLSDRTVKRHIARAYAGCYAYVHGA